MKEVKFADNPVKAVGLARKYDFYIIRFKLIGHSIQHWVLATSTDLRLEEGLLRIKDLLVPVELIEAIELRFKSKLFVNEYDVSLISASVRAISSKNEVKIKVSASYFSDQLEYQVREKFDAFIKGTTKRTPDDLY